MIFFFLLGTGETEEEKENRLNYGTLPEHLWKIIPSHGAYMENLLKFAGYNSRASIVKLKDKEEMKKVVAFAAEHAYLIEKDDLKKTFGIFAKNPEAVKVLPGLEPDIKRFIDAVENLIPKKPKPATPPQASKRTAESTSSVSDIVGKKSKATHTVESIQTRFKSWLVKELVGKDITVDEGMKLLAVKESDNAESFIATCKQKGCRKTWVLTPVNEHCNMGNIHRHIRDSCWLSPKVVTVNAPKKLPLPQGNSIAKSFSKWKPSVPTTTEIIEIDAVNQDSSDERVHFERSNGSSTPISATETVATDELPTVDLSTSITSSRTINTTPKNL